MVRRRFRLFSFICAWIYVCGSTEVKHAKDLPEFDRLIENGDFQPIRKWLTEHAYIHGKRKKPLEIIKSATGEELNVRHLIRYLEEKYTTLYL